MPRTTGEPRSITSNPYRLEKGLSHQRRHQRPAYAVPMVPVGHKEVVDVATQLPPA